MSHLERSTFPGKTGQIEPKTISAPRNRVIITTLTWHAAYAMDIGVTSGIRLLDKGGRPADIPYPFPKIIRLQTSKLLSLMSTQKIENLRVLARILYNIPSTHHTYVATSRCIYPPSPARRGMKDIHVQ